MLTIQHKCKAILSKCPKLQEMRIGVSKPKSHVVEPYVLYMFFYMFFSALLESLKTQSENQIATTRKNISEAKTINKENECLAYEHEEYANYLNGLVSKMNNSMSTKVGFSPNLDPVQTLTQILLG